MSYSYKIINSSAGSGKTFYLAIEFIAQLLNSKKDDHYKSMLALTFTNKASAEMKDRILSYLNVIVNENENDIIDIVSNKTTLNKLEIKEKAFTILKNILYNYSSFNVMTIDSFTNNILKSFKSESDIEKDYLVELDSMVYIDQAIDDIFIDINDDDNSTYNNESQVYEIDSIFGNRNASFDLKVYQLTYYLSSLDPNNNFESSKEYFSNDNFYQKGFYGKTLHDDKVTLNFEEIPVLYSEDDPNTEPDELTEVNYFETPRLRAPLDVSFFQRYIMNQEGSDKLTNQANFNNYFNGLIVRAENFSDDLFMSLDIFNAKVVLEYDYNFYNTKGTDDVSDDIIERKKKVNTIPLGGVTYNLHEHTGYNQEIVEEVSASEDNIPSEKIYLNGTKFMSKLKLFSDDNSISSELQELKAKDVLINEASIVLHLDKNIHKSNYQFLPQRLYVYSYKDGEPIEDYNKDFSQSFSPSAVNANKFLFGGLLQLSLIHI